ncbi:MerR family transcriptional regulator [Intrasporangium oryzae NRRL B-24470]|uniref:MerR family transcriptional regulator n=1 Tax=Intrasporangium oryzae NRRL B-24470 TaxID=1386089 RepID=W9G3L1_9MICO|nr:MerR family transcriptional regulator [Intrasporangium oryzae]EWT00726.1 MerR family transcriptional regulator [Intrasporangium oryzae NRRL B-24470]
MRISQLADATGVGIPTLKYYLREGLLHAGEAESATRASYDASHVERVRLVRTLIDVGRLSIERVREVVAALEHPPATRHELLGTAHDVLRAHDQPRLGSPADGIAPAAVGQVAALGAPPCADSPAARQLGLALTAASAAGWPISDHTLETWAGAMRTVAGQDIDAALAGTSSADALRYAIVGNVLTDPVIIALRRVAQEQLSAEMLGGTGGQFR